MIKVRVCPFCGGEARLIIHKYSGVPDTFGVRCLTCSAETWQFFEDEKDALRAWNTRAKPESPTFNEAEVKE